VPSKETEAVVAALSQHVRKLPATLRRSLTWDRGLEMAKHKEFRRRSYVYPTIRTASIQLLSTIQTNPFFPRTAVS
jgi:IS30 family transposase